MGWNSLRSKKHVVRTEKHDKATKGFSYRGGSRIFFRRGCTRLLLYFNTNKPHSFFCRIQVVLENRRSSQGGRDVHPLHPPLDPPLSYVAIGETRYLSMLYKEKLLFVQDFGLHTGLRTYF